MENPEPTRSRRRRKRRTAPIAAPIIAARPHPPLRRPLPRQRRATPENGADSIGPALLGHIGALRRYAMALTRHAADADDLVQETLKRALGYGLGGREIGDLRAYLMTILHNIRQDELLRRRRGGLQVDLSELEPVAVAASANERIACREATAAMARLPQPQRVALALVAVNGLSYREAAATLGLPIGTLMSRLNRARAALRRALDPPEAEPEPDAEAPAPRIPRPAAPR